MYTNLVVDWVDNYMGKGFSVSEKDAGGCSSCSGSC
ncbi:Fe-S cluster assembly iron-binding protein IscA [Peptococcaceae bacterium DYL19]|nr:Fe-S cluster assembly iron-binding protein IscA [Phosphitispora fastidiosa]